VTDLARAFEDAGVAAIIYTDIDRDGAMQGPNVAATEALARATTIPVIADVC
jgi:phosphoribosylformimino-5-aminoimidazole carboxamide ribotide isomerase